MIIKQCEECGALVDVIKDCDCEECVCEECECGCDCEKEVDTDCKCEDCECSEDDEDSDCKCECGCHSCDDCDCDCDCGCGIMCCGKPMVEVKANSTDGAVEKHKPEYKVDGDMMEISVNHVMEGEHYIEWIRVVTDNEILTHIFKPGEEAKVVVPYKKGAKLYSYCNKHGLWETVVE